MKIFKEGNGEILCLSFKTLALSFLELSFHCSLIDFLRESIFSTGLEWSDFIRMNFDIFEKITTT